MPKTVALVSKCAGCDALLRKVTGKKKHVKNESEANDFSSSSTRMIIVDDSLCDKCRLCVYEKNPEKNVEPETERDPSSESETDNPSLEIWTKGRN